MTAPELKPCPFCGVHLESRTDYARHPQSNCPISSMVVFAKGNEDWNRRADLAAVPAQVRVKPLDVAHVQRHAFLSGVVAALNAPRHEPINGPALWLDYDPGDNPALSRILAALEPQPDPRDEVIARLVEALENRLHDPECPCNACEPMLAALAAAKAVQHG